MPYEEDKMDLSEFAKNTEKKANENPTKDKTLMWPCEQCGGSFKMGYNEEKKKDLPLNPDGSRHQKWKYPPKEVDGKKVWEWTCTKSKDDWSQKGFIPNSDQSTPKPSYNQNFPIKSSELIAMIKANSGRNDDVVKAWVNEGVEHGWYSLARFAGTLIVCEIIGNTAGAFVGMHFNDGGKK